MSIWIAIAIGFFFGGVAAVLSLIDMPLKDQLSTRDLVARAAKCGLIGTAIIWSITNVWMGAVASQ